MSLEIQIAENGFIVNIVEGDRRNHAPNKFWAFESAVGLSEFIKQWGRKIELEKIEQANMKTDSVT